MDVEIRVQILAKPGYISHSINTVGKGMNPTILLPSKLQRLGSLTFGIGNQFRTTKTQNSNPLNPAKKLILCHILLVRREWVNTYLFLSILCVCVCVLYLTPFISIYLSIYYSLYIYIYIYIYLA